MRELAVALAFSFALMVAIPSVVALQSGEDPDQATRESMLAASRATPSASARPQRSARPSDCAADPCSSPESATDSPAPLENRLTDAAPAQPMAEAVDVTSTGLTPNEAGQILVLEYHLIEEPAGRWSRTPEALRADIERLISEGYYPINLIDLARGNIDVPAGKSPVVLTFDDSSSGQCRYSSEGEVDADSACGILLEAARERPLDWRTRATFFVLIDVDVPDRELFGQPEWAPRKLTDLVSWGMEIGSHTVSHVRLDKASAETIRQQLADAETTLEQLIPGYEIRSLSLPMGAYPSDERLLLSGEWLGRSYDVDAAVEVAGGPSPSPHSRAFNPMHIRRTQVFGDELGRWLDYFAAHPELRYVSDGRPDIVSVPESAASSLAQELPPLSIVVLSGTP